MEELIPVNIVIADRSYRIRIAKADEEKVRQTAALINQKIAEFKTQFAGKDMQDFVSMALLWFATEETDAGLATIQQEQAINQIRTVEQWVNQALNS
ncbi:MAG: cell division protein ZapA [Chitinophagia bacterium]|nr:cell division protein ZapA [Chitinophagia bacterium]